MASATQRSSDLLAPTSCVAASRASFPALLSLEQPAANNVTCLRRSVRFECQDLRRTLPPEVFDLILCRNLAFSYFDIQEQCRVLRALIDRLRPGGHLVIGLHERLPSSDGLHLLSKSELIFRRDDAS